MTHKEIYKLTTELHESGAMQHSNLCPESAIEAVNFLRQNVRTLIKLIHECNKDREDIKKVADMYKKIDKAKERVFIDAVDKKIDKDWDDITSYDARTGKTVTACLSGAVGEIKNLDDCIVD